MQALTSLLIPMLLFVGMFILACLGHQLLSLLWTLLMSSYNLSLPGLLWGGTWNIMPVFIPSTQSPIMHFYYWFMLFGFIAILAAMIISAFRHLAIWGKFDEQQTFRGEGFGKQFLWFIGLCLMTLLTPVIIWAVYSVFMLGVLFLNQLAGSALVLNISEDDYKNLLAAFKNDLLALQNCDVSTLQSILTKLANDQGVIALLRNRLGNDEQLVQQVLWDMKNIATQYGEKGMVELRALATNILNQFDTYGFSNPLTADILSELGAKINIVRNTIGSNPIKANADVYIYEQSFWECWSMVFNNANFTFKDIVESATLGAGDKKIAEEFLKLYEATGSAPSAANPFSVFGHGGLMSSLDSTKASTFERLSGQATYTKAMFNQLSKNIGINYLTFKNGREVGLATCPLEVYLTAVITGSSGTDIVTALGAGMAGLTAGIALLVGGINVAAIEIPIPMSGTIHPLVPLGVIMIVTGFTLLITIGVPFLVQLLIWFGGFKVLIKPILGMVMFLWASFFEAAWYFLLLLPAIGTCLGENGTETYKRTWKTMFGKMATVLVLWGGLILLVAAMGCIEGFADQIFKALSNQAQSTDITEILIKFEFNAFASKLMQRGINILVIRLSIRAIIEFILAIVCLNSAFKFMQKIGTLGFGEGAYGDMNNYLSQPLNAIAPGVAAIGMGALGGMKAAGGVAMQAGVKNARAIKDGSGAVAGAKLQAHKANRQLKSANKYGMKADKQAAKAAKLQAKKDAGFTLFKKRADKKISRLESKSDMNVLKQISLNESGVKGGYDRVEELQNKVSEANARVNSARDTYESNASDTRQKAILDQMSMTMGGGSGGKKK